MQTQNSDEALYLGLAKTKEQAKFIKVKDRLGHPVLGLWRRGAKFYFQTRLRGEKSSRKFPLKTERYTPVTDLKEAQSAIEKLRKDLAEGTLVTRKVPGFSDLADKYLVWVKQLAVKTDRTISTETPAINGWKKFLGNIPANQIMKAHISAYAALRKKANPGISNRTINLDVIALASVLKLGVQEELLTRNVALEWERLPYLAPKRELISLCDIEKLCAEAVKKTESGRYVYESGQALSDYIKLMAFSGARRDSALAILWEDVSWSRKQLWLRKAKFSKTNIHVDLNEKLENHLLDMESRKLKDGKFLFPSSVNPEKAITTLNNTFTTVREAAGCRMARRGFKPLSMFRCKLVE